MSSRIKDLEFVIFFAVVVVTVLLVIWFVFSEQDRFAEHCAAAGGEPVELYRDHLCLRPGVVIHLGKQ